MENNQEKIKSIISVNQGTINEFFDGNQALVNTFNTLFADMLTLDDEVVLIRRREILLVARTNERSRFYVIQFENKYFIKFKILEERTEFNPSMLDEYLSYNKECYKFFLENKERITLKVRRRRTCIAYNDNEERENPISFWNPLREKAENCLLNKTYDSDDFIVEDVYNKLIGIFKTAVQESGILNSFEEDIFINRTLSTIPQTLQCLGEKYGFSREGVRLKEISTLNRLYYYIYKLRNSNSILYANQIKELLLSIPDDKLIGVIEGIYNRNNKIGHWLQVLCTRDKIKILKRVKSSDSSRAEKEVDDFVTIDQITKIRNSLDIIKFISSRFTLTCKDDVYYTTCPF